MTRSLAAYVMTLLIVGALPADAQICAGRASFNLASTRFELDGSARSIEAGCR